jgi:hypothetical protein
MISTCNTHLLSCNNVYYATHMFMSVDGSVKRSYSSPWRHIGFCDFKTPTFFTRSAHRWWLNPLQSPFTVINISNSFKTDLLCRRRLLFSSGQCSWLQIQRSWFNSRCYQIFRKVVGLERCPLSIVTTIEELLGRTNSVSGLETENTALGMLCWPCNIPYPQKLALTSPTSGRSV